jgi:pilus assembly protein CpaF
MPFETHLGYWLGPLEAAFRDAEVSEIMVLDFDRVFVERRGKVGPEPATFPDRRALQELIERLLLPLGRELTQASPYADGRLGDGVRFTATMPPLTPAPTLTIRKVAKVDLERAWLEALDGDERPMRILRSWVKNRRNVVIAGAAGTGKTSLVRLLAEVIDPSERLLTIEETRELELGRVHPHVVALETRSPNRAGLYAIDLEDLLRLALHMRPDRIIVGEIRGRETVAWLSALDTGHRGSLTTLHATSAWDVTERLVYAAAPARSMPPRLLRVRLRHLLGGVVHLERGSGGQRRPTMLLQYDEGRGGQVWP